MSTQETQGAGYQADLQTLTEALVHTGCGERINPESLTDFMDYTDKWGWSMSHPTKTGLEVRLAFNSVMDGFRALFAPAVS